MKFEDTLVRNALSTNICIKAERAIFFTLSSLFAYLRRNFVTLKIFNHFKDKTALIFFVLSSSIALLLYLFSKYIIFIFFNIFLVVYYFLTLSQK